MLWIYVTRENEMLVSFQTEAATKEEATLNISEELRKYGYIVDMKDILQTIHPAPDENDNG